MRNVGKRAFTTQFVKNKATASVIICRSEQKNNRVLLKQRATNRYTCIVKKDITKQLLREICSLRRAALLFSLFTKYPSMEFSSPFFCRVNAPGYTVRRVRNRAGGKTIHAHSIRRSSGRTNPGLRIEPRGIARRRSRQIK